MQNEDKKKFSFKEYYQNNPEFRKRHLAKLMQKSLCVACGCEVTVSNSHRHLQSTKHKLKAGFVQAENKPLSIKAMFSEINSLKEKIEQLENLKRI